MTPQHFGEADTRAKFITPALHKSGWGEELILREFPVGAGAVEIGQDGVPHRAAPRQADYLLHVKTRESDQRVPVAFLEAKKESLPPNAGMEQAREYARLFHVPFVFSSNGHQFAEMDLLTGLVSDIRKMSDFPGPDELRRRYERARGFSLAAPPAAPLLARYTKRSGEPRYYQDAAIRAAMEKIAAWKDPDKGPRVLLPLATGSGKTFVAVNLLRRISEQGGRFRVLFLCDRRELRDQARAAFEKEFGAAVAVVENRDGENPAKNAQIHIATYQTLGVGRDADADEKPAADDGAVFNRLYPDENHFTHIVVDECHRSGFNKWSVPLVRNPRAVHIGLTATPRVVNLPVRFRKTDETREERKIEEQNFGHFGERVYEYPVEQGMDDGYLALLLLDEGLSNLDMRGGLSGAEVAAHKPVDIATGEIVPKDALRPHYAPATFERELHLPDRVREMCADLFRKMQSDDPKRGPDQKTVVFCESDHHAEVVAEEMQNLRAKLARDRGETPSDRYAFKCTARAGGVNTVRDFKTLHAERFVAATVDLLSTGVDLPPVRNIVFFRHLKSPVLFHQMLGRGTRIDEETGKFAFHVYDYTGASALMGEKLAARVRPKKPREKNAPEPDDSQPARKIRVDGLEVWINRLGRFVLANGEKISRAEYERRVAARLREEVPELADFRARWMTRERRAEMMQFIADAGLSPNMALVADGRDDLDLYDYLAQAAWDADPKTRKQRAADFLAAGGEWLDAMDPDAAATVRAIIALFADSGTDELEDPDLFAAPRVEKAGGLNALKKAGPTNETMTEIKRRLFAD